MSPDRPSVTDPVVRAASAVVGGPAGRRLATGRGFWWAAPVLVLMAVLVLSAGVVQKQHCRAQGWSTPDQFWHACYSDIAVLYDSGGLGDASARPGPQAVSGPEGLGQPPLVGAAMWLVSAFAPEPAGATPGSAAAAEGAREFFDLSTAVLAVLLAAAVGLLAVTAARVRGRPWDAAHLALAPVLITAGLVSYSLLAVALLAAALHAWHRGRAVPAGIWLGLAVAAAPALAAVGVALLLLAGRTRWPTPSTVGVAVLTWFVTRLLLVGGLGGLLGALNDWRTSLPGYGSLWLVPQLLADAAPQGGGLLARLLDGLLGWAFGAGGLGAGAAAVLCLLLFAGLVAVIVRVTATRHAAGPDDDGPRLLDDDRPAPERAGHAQVPPAALAPLALAVLAAALLSATTLPPQSSLLLLPLIALSGLRWRDHLVWATTECAYFVGVWLYIAGQSDPSRGLPAAVFLILLLARAAGIAWIGVCGVLRYRAEVAAAGLVPAPLGRGGRAPGRHSARVPGDDDFSVATEAG